ncbi:uncharacterized protein [Emydura macquarii macquarii]|uniref:uncharacterized protein n=1 Tax=Emydura macquarii macquarii TaxID=1129001 RepID=UPI00352AD366
MRKLYELVPSWETGHKNRLYQVLKVTDRALIEELEGAGGSEQKPSASASAGTTGEHFVERHQEQLIQRVSSVDQVLDLLRRDVLTPEKYRSIRIYPETMRKLYDLVQPWDRKLKDRLYQALKETNRALVEELEGEHFVDQHREQLIQRVSSVDILCRRVLGKEQSRSVVTDPVKMRKLYELVPHWDTGHKDQLHQALRATNQALVKELEGVSCFLEPYA